MTKRGERLAGVSSLQPMGHVWPRMAVNAAQHKIINLLKHYEIFFVVTCCNVFTVWLKTTHLLPVWPRDAKMLDTPDHTAALDKAHRWEGERHRDISPHCSEGHTI